MKRALLLSLVANAILGVMVLWPKVGSDNGTNRSAAGPPEVVSGEKQPADAIRWQSPGKNREESFRWSEIEASDYRKYVANLRGIGCPEQTVRDIITADVHSLYGKRRAQLAGVASTQATMEQLQIEETAVLQALLGRDPGASPESPVSPPRRFVRRQPTTISMPLALQQVDLAALDLSPAMLASIQDVRQRFADEMNGSGLAPSDPAYRVLWQKTQAACDELLQAMLGGERYIDYEVAVRIAAANADTN
jgi:hypothetical protein